jgi:phage tail sheath protein FI
VELAGPPPKGKDKDKDKDVTAPAAGAPARPSVSMNGFGTAYFPWLVVNDALTAKPVKVPPSGHVAGIWSSVKVHQAPANIVVNGAIDLSYKVTGPEQGDLNSHGINCIRYFSNEGILVWGARTLAEESSEWRYVPVRRLLIMIEQTILRNTRFAVFQPNDPTLWKTITGAVTKFLRTVYHDGALMGATAEEAFFVKCDAESNPQEIIDLGQVVTVIGVAPVKPAEFIIFQIGQTEAGAVVQAL